MVDSSFNLSISTQCRLLSISKSGYYYHPKGESILNLKLMRLIDEIYLASPCFGSRQMARYINNNYDYCVSRKRIRRLMRLMGLCAIYQAPRTTISNQQHKTYPYLLRNLNIISSNHVWCADITYIPIGRGRLYLIAIMDWHSRKVLSWRLSSSMDVSFCIEALEEGLSRYGRPAIFNTDQGSQFTSFEFTHLLKDNNIRISMDGKGRWVDNVFIERLWRSLKYECVYLHNFEDGKTARHEIGKYLEFYNKMRPHSSFDGQTPNDVYNKTKYYHELAHDNINQQVAT